MNDLAKFKHQDRLMRFSDEHKTLYERLARLSIEDLIFLRDQLERIRIQEQRSKLKGIKSRAVGAGASVRQG